MAKKKLQKGTKSSVDSRKIICVSCFGESSQDMNTDTTSPTTLDVWPRFLESMIFDKTLEGIDEIIVKIRNKKIE